MLASRSVLLLTFTVGLLSLTGCRICTDCEDEAYPTYGGIWQRTDRFNGRVGSLFAPAGAKIDRASTGYSDEAMGGGSQADEETAHGGEEEELEILPPGERRLDEERSPGETVPSEHERTEPGDAEAEEVQLQQPFGNPGDYVDF